MSDIDDLMAAFESEAEAHHRRYTEFAQKADEIGYAQVARHFRALVAVETARVRLYRRCLVECQTHTFEIYICPECGLALTEAAPDKCLLCGTPGTRFERIP